MVFRVSNKAQQTLKGYNVMNTIHKEEIQGVTKENVKPLVSFSAQKFEVK
jgi:hypothetical protein